MISNIEYSKEWLTKKIIETDLKEKENLIKIKEVDLYKLILKFIKLNERGE